jgi:hypothetical protein
MARKTETPADQLTPEDSQRARKKEPRKRTTRKQLDERLAIPLDTHTTIEAILKVDPDSPEAIRQRIRDRAGDEPPPKGSGRARK